MAQPGAGARFPDDGDVVDVEAAHVEFRSRAHGGRVEGHVAGEDVAVDVGENQVEGAELADALGAAQGDLDVGRMVDPDVLERVAVGPLVDVDGYDLVGPFHPGEDGEDGRAASHVERPLASRVEAEDVGEHQVGRGVVARPERHFGVDQYIIGKAFLRLVEGGPDGAFPPDADGLEIMFFPFLVPVPVLDALGLVGEMGDGEGERGQRLGEARLVVLVLRHVGGQPSLVGEEALVVDPAQLARQDVVDDLGVEIALVGEFDFVIVHVVFWIVD